MFGRRFVSGCTTAKQAILLSEKPVFTGAGPFIELPSFTAIGDPSNLLNITVPSSSFVNIKSGSLVAIDGDLNGMTSSRQMLTAQVDYQKLYVENPVSLIINGNNHYSIINVDKTEKWKVIDSSNIIAWSGFTLDLKSVALFKKFFSFETFGQGKLILQGSNQLFEIDIDRNEEVLINPNSLVATNSPIIISTPLNNSRIDWPKLKIGNMFNNRVFHKINHYYGQFVNYLSQQLAKLGLNALFDPISHYYSVISRQIKFGWNWFTLNLIYPFSTKPIYLQIKGPCRLLVNNVHSTKNRKMFTKQEIQQIFQGNSKSIQSKGN